jgi:hypothetical protein
MKRLPAVVMMIATGVLMVTTIASAGGWWGAIHGDYEMVATGACLHSKQPFVSNGGNRTIATPLVLSAPASTTDHPNDWFLSTYMGEGIWTFGNDGTGTMEVMQSCILPNKVTETLVPSYGLRDPQGNLLDWETIPFTYVVEGNALTVTIAHPVYLTLKGKISSDHKTLTLQSSMQQQFNGGLGYYQVCTITRTLTRTRE